VTARCIVRNYKNEERADILQEIMKDKVDYGVIIMFAFSAVLISICGCMRLSLAMYQSLRGGQLNFNFNSAQGRFVAFCFHSSRYWRA